MRIYEAMTEKDWPRTAGDCLGSQITCSVLNQISEGRTHEWTARMVARNLKSAALILRGHIAARFKG